MRSHKLLATAWPRSTLAAAILELCRCEPESFSYLFDRSGFFQFTFRGQAVTGPIVMENGMDVAMRSLSTWLRTGQCGAMSDMDLLRTLRIMQGSGSELAILVEDEVDFPLSDHDAFFLPRPPDGGG